MKNERGAFPANTGLWILAVVGIVVIVWLLLGALGHG